MDMGEKTGENRTVLKRGGEEGIRKDHQRVTFVVADYANPQIHQPLKTHRCGRQFLAPTKAAFVSVEKTRAGYTKRTD
jgi:hypothetical protein